MSIRWGQGDVRVFAANASILFAARFAEQHPVLFDRLKVFLSDPEPAVRLQVAQNLQLLAVVSPDRMWEMGERIAQQETHSEIIASYLNYALRPFIHSETDSCEKVLKILQARIHGEFDQDPNGRNDLLEAVGSLAMELYVRQGRALARMWLEDWAGEPERVGALLNHFSSCLRGALFQRYAIKACAEEYSACDRAQDCLALILNSSTLVATEAYGVLQSDAVEAEKKTAGLRYDAAELGIHHAMNQLYFGSGAHASDQHDSPGLPDAAAMAKFLNDYEGELRLIARSRQPSTLYYLIGLYGFLIPGNPVAVFEAIHAILLGRGEEEGYQYESLGNTAVVEILQRYIADYRLIFDDEGRRHRLVEILKVFSEVGWTDAMKLLYDLPDLLR